MKVELIAAPSAKDARTAVVRHVPENETDEKVIAKMKRVLTGMNLLITFPEIKGKIGASFLFNRNEKRAGAKP